MIDADQNVTLDLSGEIVLATLADEIEPLFVLQHRSGCRVLGVVLHAIEAIIQLDPLAFAKLGVPRVGATASV
jgi:hypothetical protein